MIFIQAIREPLAQTIRSVGTNVKPVKEPEQRAMAWNYTHSPVWVCALSNLSLPAATSMVSEQPVGDKSLNWGMVRTPSLPMDIGH
jgi:hypothetical protein